MYDALDTGLYVSCNLKSTSIHFEQCVGNTVTHEILLEPMYIYGHCTLLSIKINNHSSMRGRRGGGGGGGGGEGKGKGLNFPLPVSAPSFVVSCCKKFSYFSWFLPPWESCSCPVDFPPPLPRVYKTTSPPKPSEPTVVY